MMLTLDFQGQISKSPYLGIWRVDWHGMKAMWVDKMLAQYATLTLDFQGQNLK